ncbi:MAG: UDP-N-acetylglucosamine--N-acetylmuramyl-(pentapeptide) pyrophosphoryl-undecaprenol N-acetylglucosamine transferase, partial [Phycisphaerae bacterium]
MEKWFPADKIMLTGNPVRQQVADIAGKRDEAIRHFQLDVSRPVILAMGGSLGARTMNDAVQAFADKWIEAGCQVIWQSGKGGAEQAR